MSSEARLVPIGRVLHPHGIGGGLLIEPYLNDLIGYHCLCEVAVLLADGQFQRYRVMHIRQVGGRLLLHLEGCVSREMARPLVGSELCIRREELPPPPDGEFYWWDLEGLTVYTEDGECLGRVEEFFPTGSNDVLVVRKGVQETLLPFIKDVILAVDAAQGILQVRAIPGLL
ncbi:MAG: ribosome maturation factor RimM [Candidatus Entotheonellia bacterium]